MAGRRSARKDLPYRHLVQSDCEERTEYREVLQSRQARKRAFCGDDGA